MHKEVLHTLTRYLATHDLLGIAGVGYLRRVYRPARFSGNQLKAPGSSWYYEADKSVPVTDTGFLQCFTSTVVTAVMAEKDLQNLFESVFSAVVLKGNFSYQGLGTFIRKEERIEMILDAAHYVDSLSIGLESILVRTAQKEVKEPAVMESVHEAESQPMEKPGITVNQWLRIAAAVLILISVNFILINYLEYTGTSSLQQSTLGDFDIDSGTTTTVGESGEIGNTSQTPDGVQSDSDDLRPENQPAETETIPLLESKPAKFALPANQNFSVIVGAFKDLSNAERYVRSLIDLGYEAHLAGNTSGGLHRVSAGSFDEMKIAESFAETLKTQNKIDAWVMETSR